MEGWGLVAASVAAVAALVGLGQAWRSDRRRRFTDVADLLQDLRLRAYNGVGPQYPETKARLETRLHGLDLPKTRALVGAPLKSGDSESVALVEEALAEVHAKLARFRRAE